MIERFKDSRTLLGIGLLSLVLSLLSQLFIHPAANFWRDAVDGMNGFFIGVALPLLWLAWYHARKGGQPCASTKSG